MLALNLDIDTEHEVIEDSRFRCPSNRFRCPSQQRLWIEALVRGWGSGSQGKLIIKCLASLRDGTGDLNIK